MFVIVLQNIELEMSDVKLLWQMITTGLCMLNIIILPLCKNNNATNKNRNN